jgi:hypothetical protein
MFRRNVELSPNYTGLQPRRHFHQIRVEYNYVTESSLDYIASNCRMMVNTGLEVT